ncbi:MAG TPA: protein kinase [Gemmatimonadaceae bacterium]|nr:protein kinase [Gemmatimonadaceae bacterium]
MSLNKVCPQCGAIYGAESRFCSVDGATLVLEQPADDLVGTIVADRYHILERIGAGGMGEVFLAEHVRMKRKSALKVMREALTSDPVAVSRFHREAENASQISHPNVAAVYDFGETANGLVYIAMEYIPGEPLSVVLEEEGALNAARVGDIIAQAADALSAAHGLGILHRDLKPDNIMLTSTRWGTDLVKLVDFGISRAMASATQQFTSTGIIVGTPDYMSPEQFTGDNLDSRSDQYALALIAYYSLTGTFPFPPGSSKEALLTRLTTQPRKLADARPDVEWPASLQATLDRALALNVSERYDEVHEFGRDVEAAVAEMPGTPTMEHYREALRNRFTTPSRSPSVTPPRPIHSLELTPPTAMPSVDGVIEKPSDSAPTQAVMTEPEVDPTTEAPVRRPSRAGRLTAVVAGLGIAALVVWKLAGAGNDAGPSAPPPAEATASGEVPQLQAPTPSTAEPVALQPVVLLDSAAALARSGVFTVYGAGQQGAGFLVDSLGILLTARELAEGASEPTIQLDADRRVRGRVMAVDSSRGIAALRIPWSLCKRCSVLPLPADSVAQLAVGDSLAVPTSVTRGTASVDTKGAVTQNDRRGVQANLRVAATGSPVVTGRGVVGLALRRPRGAATVVTADALNALRNSARRRSREVVPNDSLVPSWPVRPVPTREINAALTRSEADLQPLQVSQDGLTVLLMTPQIMAWRSDQVRQNLAAQQVMAISDTQPRRRIDPIQNWIAWTDYVSERRAVVVLHVTPDLAAYNRQRPQGVVDLKGGDVLSVRLYRDNVLVTPIETTRIPAMVNPEAYRAQNRHVYNAGIGVYTPRDFAPKPDASWPEIRLEIADARPNRTVKIILPVAALQAVQRDLSSYQR